MHLPRHSHAQAQIMPSDALNAFATGLNQKQYAITVTSALLNTLDDAEVEAVLGHELTHIRNGDVRLLVIAVVIAGVISFFGELVFRMLFYSRMGMTRRGGSRGRGGGGAGAAILIALALIALAWLLSVVIRFALSRSREFLADAGSVELTKNPDAMISALRKIEGRGELHGSPSAVMEMCVDNPREDFSDCLPPIPLSINALKRWCAMPAVMIRARSSFRRTPRTHRGHGIAPRRRRFLPLRNKKARGGRIKAR